MTRQQAIDQALDVACGTGLSTIALAEYASFVVGVDPVDTMLRLAPTRGNTAYVCAAAERLPVRSHTINLVTVSSGVHWFDQYAFFAEAARVLRRDGWLAIYDHFFRGSLDDHEINRWLKRSYAEKYPPPERGAGADASVIVPEPFLETELLEYEDPIDFTHEELVAYLMSHSNTLAPAAEGRETPEQTETWLCTETSRWFSPPPKRTFLFRGVARVARIADQR